MVTKNNRKEIQITDKMLSMVARVCCGLLISAFTINFFGFDSIGTNDEISLQLADTAVPTVAAVASVETLVYAPGINSNAYSELKDIDKTVDKYTFVVKEQISDTGVPMEILDESEFTPDGSKMWIKNAQANVRSNPTVESEIVTTLSYADRVIRLSYGKTWSKVRLEDNSEGYMLTELLSGDEILKPTATPTPRPATPTPKPQSNPVVQQATETSTSNQSNVTVNANETSTYMTVYASCSLNLRSGPGTDCSLVRVLNTGDEITVVAYTDDGWYKTAKGNYVKASLCTETKPDVSSSSGGSSSSGISSYCLQFVGCSYVYAGSSPSGFDCSGFVMYVYANYYGISLPHSADSISKYGTAISSSEMQPGDVICNDHNGDGYMDHVSIYIGDGLICHASTSTTGVITSNFADVRDVATIRRIR